MEIINDKIESLNKFFNFVKNRDYNLISHYYKYNKDEKANT